MEKLILVVFAAAFFTGIFLFMCLVCMVDLAATPPARQHCDCRSPVRSHHAARIVRWKLVLLFWLLLALLPWSLLFRQA